MNNRICRVIDGRVYDCAQCPYGNRETNFCGFCMRKILDDMKALKAKKTAKGEEHGDKISDDNETV